MEATQQEIAYWRARMAVEQATAKAAADPRVKQVHEVMAMRYLGWIDRASAKKLQAA